jgi:hypothetical protein
MRSADQFVLSEIARRLGLSSPTVGNWRSRYNDFPQPSLVEGKREYWTIEQIEDFMIVMGLDGRGRRSRTQHLRITDYTKVVNLVELISPIFRPDEALIYFLAKAWDSQTNSPSKNLTQLAKRVQDNKTVSIFAETINRSLDENEMQIVDKTNDFINQIIGDDSLRATFLQDIRNLWAQSGRERASTTNPEVLGDIIAFLCTGKDALEMCAGLGSTLAKFDKSTQTVAQEIDPLAAAALFILLGLEGIQAEILVEDSIRTLHRDWLNRFDVVIAIPPSRSQGLVADNLPSDPRWMKFDSVRLKSEEAWILNALAYLKPTGTAIIGLPTKWMTSSSSSKFRKKLVGWGRVKAAVSLGFDLYSDNRVEMTLLILSGVDQPNENIRLVNARNIGVQQSGPRYLDKEAAKEISQLAAKNWRDLHWEETEPEELIEDVHPASLLELGCPLEFSIFQTSRPIDIKIDHKKIQKSLNQELARLAEEFDSFATQLRALARTDSAVNYGPNHPVSRLGDIAEVSVFSRAHNSSWPSFDVLPGDIYISLIRGSGSDNVVSDHIELSMEANEGNPNPYDLIASFTRVCRIRLLPDYIDIAKILHIYLDSPLVKSRLMKVAESSYKSAISGDVVRNLSIPLPPPEVRKRIQDMYVNAYELDFSLFYGLQNVDNWNNLLKQLITGMIYKGKS